MMTMTPIAPHDIPHEWAEIGPWIVKASSTDKNADLRLIVDRLMNGQLGAYRASGQADGVLTAAIHARTDGGTEFWIEHLGGEIFGGPKQRAAIIVSAVAQFERIAREAGCMEICLAGRLAWARILTDFTLTEEDGIPVLRKAL